MKLQTMFAAAFAIVLFSSCQKNAYDPTLINNSTFFYFTNFNFVTAGILYF
jgi:hypothetical protein